MPISHVIAMRHRQIAFLLAAVLLATAAWRSLSLEPAAAQRPAASAQAPPAGKFGRAIDIVSMPLRTKSLESYGRFPLTVDLWCKLPSEKMQRFQLLASNAPGGGAAHWEIYSTPLQGHLTAKLSAFEPRQVESFVRITDDVWHYVALTCDGHEATLYLDGKQVARQAVTPAKITAAEQRSGDAAKTPGSPAKAPSANDLEFFVGSDVPQNHERPLPALVDELRISTTVRRIESVPTKPWAADEHTAGLWHFDEEKGNRRQDASKFDNALAYSPGISSAWTPRSSARPDAEAWEKATDDDWLDGRVNQMDKGPFWGCSMSVPPSLGNKEGPYVARGLVLRLGDKGEASMLFDRARMQMAAAWLGGIHIPDRRFGLIEHPKPVGKVVFSTPSRPVCDEPNFMLREDEKRTHWAPLPEEWAKYHGVYLLGRRAVVSYYAGSAEVLEMPWIRLADGLTAVTRTLHLEGTSPLRNRLQTTLYLLASPTAKRQQVAGIDMIVSEDKEDVLAVALAPADAAVAKSQAKLAVNEEKVLLEVNIHEADLTRDQHNPTARVQLALWRGARSDLQKFAKLVRDIEPADDLREFARSGPPAKWKTHPETKPITTVAQLGQAKPGEPFAVDTLTLPYDNPYGSIFYVTGIGFLHDGRIAISTIYGDVWIVSGVDDKLGRLTWKRLASGMYQPLGLVARQTDLPLINPNPLQRLLGPSLRRDEIYVLERGQITALQDYDGDDRADFYMSYYNRWDETGAGHAYDTALKLAPDGSFYFFKGQASEPDCRESGCLLRVLPDGRGHEIFATGFRHPIGLGVDPVLGTITGADQQGNWMPATRIDQYRRGGFYGDMRTHHREKPPTDFDKPICWLPQYVDNSAGGQIWVPAKTWGPLAGGLLHLSWGRCTVHWLLREAVGDQVQGGAIRLPIPKLLSGPITGAFNPHDGHLYVVGLHGWQTAGEKDGCLHRIRYTGAKIYLPLELSARKDGLLVRFSEPLDPAVAGDVKNYSIEQWNYRYSEQYGSDHWSVADPNRMGHDTVKIASAALSSDGRTVLLRIPDIKPVMQMKLTYHLKAADGTPVEDTIHHTIHQLGPK